MTPAGAGERGACCSFKGLSDIVSPISGGGEPQICSGCAGNTRSGRARYLSVAAKDAKKKSARVCFHTRDEIIQRLAGKWGLCRGEKHHTEGPKSKLYPLNPNPAVIFNHLRWRV